MRQYRDNEEVEVAVAGTGAGGGVVAAKLAEAGLSVVAFDTGAFYRPLADCASDERKQDKLYRTDDRISGGEDAIELGLNNSGRAVGGSIVHFQMVALRFQTDWFRSRSRLGYGRDWPVDWREVALLCRGRGCAKDCQPGHLSLTLRRPAHPPSQEAVMHHNPARRAVVIMLRSLKMQGMAQAVTDLIDRTVVAPLV